MIKCPIGPVSKSYTHVFSTLLTTHLSPIHLLNTHRIWNTKVKDNQVVKPCPGESRSEALKRIETMTRAKRVMSKYLDQDGVDNESWLVSTMRKVCNLKEEPRLQHNINFNMTKEAAKHNTELLTSHDNNYENLLKTNKGTILSPGSKF